MLLQELVNHYLELWTKGHPLLSRNAGDVKHNFSIWFLMEAHLQSSSSGALIITLTGTLKVELR